MNTQTLCTWLICGGLVFGLGAFRPSTESGVQTGWSEWGQSVCYKGLYYRMKQSESYDQSNDVYQLQLQNTYYQDVWVSFGMREVQNANKGATDRTKLRAQTTSGSSTFFLIKGSSPRVIIDEVRFDANDTGPYYRCDK